MNAIATLPDKECTQTTVGDPSSYMNGVGSGNTKTPQKERMATMVERRQRTFASEDFLKMLEELSDELRQLMRTNADRHADYEKWFDELREQHQLFRRQHENMDNELREIARHKALLIEIHDERDERNRLLYSMKEKALGGTVMAILFFIAGAVGAAILAWAKSHIAT